jgi:hypothetical protein
MRRTLIAFGLVAALAGRANALDGSTAELVAYCEAGTRIGEDVGQRTTSSYRGIVMAISLE